MSKSNKLLESVNVIIPIVDRANLTEKYTNIPYSVRGGVKVFTIDPSPYPARFMFYESFKDGHNSNRLEIQLDNFKIKVYTKQISNKTKKYAISWAWKNRLKLHEYWDTAWSLVDDDKDSIEQELIRNKVVKSDIKKFKKDYLKPNNLNWKTYLMGK